MHLRFLNYRMEDTFMLKLKKYCLVWLCVLSGALVTGCATDEGVGFKLNDTTFYFTTGIEDDSVMKNGDYQITKGQAKLMLMLVQDNYTQLMTAEVWSYQMEGRYFSGYVYDSAKNMLARLMLVVMMAEDKGIALDDNENKAVNDKVALFYEMYKDEDLSYITEEEVFELFRMLELSDKVYAELTANIDTEISIDEARIISIQYIYSKDSMKKIESAIADLEAGYEFVTVAAKYSDSKEYAAQIGRGELAVEFEEAAFDLDAGQISEMVICNNGYYLIKCVDDNVAEKSEGQKMRIIEKRKQEQFDMFLADFAKDAYIGFDEKVWEEICNEAESQIG